MDVGEGQVSQIVYHARPRRTRSPYGTVARWDVLDFIARLTQHIPDTSQQLVRYWGYYSNAAPGKRRRALGCGERAQAPETAFSSSQSSAQRRSISWARLLRKVYEIDPLLCAYCGGELRMVAFITKLSSIRRFLAGIQAGPQEPEPLAHSPPRLELIYEPA